MERADTEGPLNDNAWRRLRAILTGLVLCRGIVLLCVFPPFEGWDEYQHVGYIVYMNETGNRPWLGQADVPASLLAQLPAFPHCNSALKQIGSLGAVGYTTFWGRDRQENPPDMANPKAARIGLYQAQHGPLYYRLVGPLFDSLGGVGDLKRSIGGLRLVNLLLTAGSVWLALGIIAGLVRDRQLTAFCSILIATQPLFLINGVRVANDALGVFLATSTIGWALQNQRHHRFVSSLGLGMSAGLAVLAKSVNFGLIPFIAACWLLTTLRQRDGRRRRVVLKQALVAAIALTCGFLLMTQSEFRANWTRFGTLTVMQESVLNRQAGHGLGDLVRTACSISWLGFFRNLWLRKDLICGGWSWAGDCQRLYFRHELLVLTGLFGWAWMVVPTSRARIGKLFHDRAFPCLCLALCLGYSISLSYHVVQSQLCWGAMSTNPWYAAAAYPWFLLLVTAGLFAWPLGRFRFVLPVLFVLFLLSTECSIVPGSMIARYTALADWDEALRRLATLQPPLYGTTTLHAAIGGVLLLASAAITEAIRPARRPLRAQEVTSRPRVSIAAASKALVSFKCHDSPAGGLTAALID
jgi:4-amino-4-deoxy-L-arabinose transferase-like glycosyltransferase